MRSWQAIECRDNHPSMFFFFASLSRNSGSIYHKFMLVFPYTSLECYGSLEIGSNLFVSNEIVNLSIFLEKSKKKKFTSLKIEWIKVRLSQHNYHKTTKITYFGDKVLSEILQSQSVNIDVFWLLFIKFFFFLIFLIAPGIMFFDWLIDLNVGPVKWKLSNIKFCGEK